MSQTRLQKASLAFGRVLVRWEPKSLDEEHANYPLSGYYSAGRFPVQCIFDNKQRGAINSGSTRQNNYCNSSTLV